MRVTREKVTWNPAHERRPMIDGCQVNEDVDGKEQNLVERLSRRWWWHRKFSSSVIKVSLRLAWRGIPSEIPTLYCDLWLCIFRGHLSG
jgi:hypothetical protein